MAGCNERAVGIPDSCGDGVLDPWEECEGSDLRGQSCEGLGFEGGILRCDDGCRLDTGECTGGNGQVCGDGICQTGEDLVNCPEDCVGDLCGDGVCQADEDPVNCPEDCEEDIPELPEPWGTPGHWWLLMHPNGASTPGAGVHLVDTNTGNLIRSLPLPLDAESPHGLAAEADRVWLSDMVSKKIYLLDPFDGSALDTLSGGYTEGLAITATGYWAVNDNWPHMSIDHRLFSGGVSLSFDMNTNTVNDLAYDGEFVYFVVNDGNDPIKRINARTGARDILVPTTIATIYTCAFDGSAVVIDNDGGRLRRYDPDTGFVIDEVEHGLGGWITAIAPAWGE